MTNTRPMTVGTMMASRFMARCWFSNWPPYSIV